ncbi:DUF342 domain-containing protein [Halalkalibacterium halodurans]|uniref:BH2430 protein n=1 Tax=Halalkalibacterium halodurans (strain ATCC BAA-125 / DSM 18197 / FERM 7344 / JCM 9153 / C-125) TaxID=272558 RepID=Q9KA60_HALH5|nr:DUF342 domain-containing protein [Halalkalibacterium halodurans]MED4124424.1 DUF342 domain-containing protein [Halalkalibacterium halodurans]MED4171180.1 DUF342 domain-containing protein [Halalkalibacterium halodurans]BAB06149.1 BH2430 [Halalkalibacterium halodurans C-125]
MSKLDTIFEVVISRDKMEATLKQHEPFPEDHPVTKDELLSFMKEHGVVFGVKESVIDQVVKSEKGLTSSVKVAEGLQPQNGKHGYLQPIQHEEEERDVHSISAMNLRDVLSIPEVKQGQVIGKKIPATLGEDGMNVLGEPIKAKPGREFVLRPGKNSTVDEANGTLVAAVDGQMSVDKRTIHVYPVYEVPGDLTMKHGNISFIGNVIIRGHVPDGFVVKAGGDIRVFGTVEGATLEAGGSIFVGAGIVGQNRGCIRAEGGLHTTFINQAKVEVGGDIEVVQSILHSTCTAGGKIICTRGKGNIVGGALSAEDHIYAKEIGNSMHTKTSLYIGAKEKWVTKEKQLAKEYKTTEEELKKLSLLLQKFQELEKENGLTANGRVQRLRVKNTLVQVKEKHEQIKEQLEDVQENLTLNQAGSIVVEQTLYPNVSAHFGKYRRKIVSNHSNVKLSLVDQEIQLSSR